MRLMRRSHTLGRISHGTFGGQAGADPTRVVAAMSLPGYEVVKLPLMPGDVAFMHSNTLHASSPNLSENWRRNIIVRRAQHTTCQATCINSLTGALGA